MQSKRKPSSRSSSIGTSAFDPVEAYAEAVIFGDIVAGPHVRNACRRHLLDLERGHERGLTWDLVAARRAIEFFPDVLRLSQSFAGEPFRLHLAQQRCPFQTLCCG
jgi:hypothetical protein